MKILSASFYKKISVAVIAGIVSVVGLTKLTPQVKSVEAVTPCIITISGIQYDVAPLTVPGVHPGGNVFVCGTDMTSLFMSVPTHAADIARMKPYVYIPPTAIPLPTTTPTPPQIPSVTPDPTITPSPVPSIIPILSPSISPIPRQKENDEVEVSEIRKEKVERSEKIESNHDQTVRYIAKNSNKSHSDND